jgi:hypothetical protein
MEARRIMKIDIGPLEFNDDAAGYLDADGVRWLITEWEGWDGANQRLTMLDITGADGMTVGESSMADRTLFFRGVVKAPDEAKFWTAYNKFLGETGLFYREAILAVNEGGVVKELGVRRLSPPKTKMFGSTFTFDIALTAAYPIKLAQIEQTAAYNGGISVDNDGNYQTWPVITMTSDGQPVFTNTSVGSAGATIGFLDEIPTGTVIDFRNKTVEGPLAGQDFYHLLSVLQDDWWPLMPGTNVLTRSGTGNADIAWRDAWL